MKGSPPSKCTSMWSSSIVAGQLGHLVGNPENGAETRHQFIARSQIGVEAVMRDERAANIVGDEPLALGGSFPPDDEPHALGGSFPPETDACPHEVLLESDGCESVGGLYNRVLHPEIFVEASWQQGTR